SSQAVRTGSWCESRQAEATRGFGSRLWPGLAGRSPRIEVPGLRVTGGIPAYAARWRGVPKAVPSPMFRRIWAAVWGHLPRGAWGNADPRHAHHARGEREILQYGLDLPRHGRPLLLQFLHLTSDSGDHEFHCRGRRHDDGLLAQRREDLVDQRFGIAARMGAGETQ